MRTSSSAEAGGRPGPPGRRARRLILLVGIALAGAMLAATAYFSWFEHREIVEAERARGGLLARLAEDQATRTFQAAIVSSAALGAALGKDEASLQPRQLQALLTQAQLGLPFLRSIAVLDLRGQVLASSWPSDAAVTVALTRLGEVPATGGTSIGPALRGRSLADLNTDPAALPRNLGFIPLLHRFDAAGARALLLVALIGPDAFAAPQEAALDAEAAGSFSLLASYQGVVLASTRDAPVGIGEYLADDPVFKTLLRAKEHDSIVLDRPSGHRLVAFRASRGLPLVAVVDRPYEAALARWRAGLRGPLAFAAAVVAFIAAMVAIAMRSMRLRDLAQARVAQNERELSVLVKSVQELIFRTDAQGTLIFVNTRWLAMSGRPASQAVGRRLADVLRAEDAAAVRQLFSETRRDGVRTAQAGLTDDTGRVRLLEIAVVPLRGAGGIEGYAGSAVDVTERRLAERQLQSQLRFTGLLLEVSPLPIAMVDPQGRLVTVNQAWEEFNGIERTEVLGRPASDYVPVAVQAGDGERREGVSVRGEARLRHADGSLRDVVVTAVKVDADDPRMAGTLCVFMDVSEYREAERATREARDAAEEASRAKSEFIANISHEMRTPLQSIIGFSELGMVRGKAHEKLAGMFQDIHAAGHRMLAVVNDLLDVSKIESTVGTFHLERTDLRGLVRAVAREVSPLLERRQLNLQVDVGEAPLLAKVDPLRIQQVVRNVLANAIKVSPEGGSIDLTGTVDGGEVVLTVRDRGPGIPPAELEKIFEAFVQSSQTKDGSGGTGLGLAICRKILDAHGGHIRAENAADGGAVFRIAVPAGRASETMPLPL